MGGRNGCGNGARVMNIIIAGGGIGGLAAAIALRKSGHDVTVIEKAARFARVGADVNLTPNAVRALDGLGIGAQLRLTAARPTHRISRDWDTGAETSRIEMADAAQQKYGAPQLTIHRADLLAALESALPEGFVQHGASVTGIDTDAVRARVLLDTGERLEADVVIGADGIHSAVRTALFGTESPVFTGVVAYRAVVPRAKLDIPNLDAFTKWWGPDPSSQIVTFPLTRGKETFVFATAAEQTWRHESWTTPGEITEVRRLYRDYHPEARALLDACDSVMKSALYIRDPLPRWSDGAVTLLGDACHPMMPFMAQGACQAIEDAVVLARALHGTTAGDAAGRLSAYEETRKPRTAAIQIGSRGNTWLRDGGNADTVYGYDAWTAALSA
jgi:salicylate hydroxylase